MGSSATLRPMTTALPPIAAPLTERDRLWDHCKNALGIARLLVREGRPTPLVDTACHMAVEAACRTALEQAGLPFEGDPARALGYLSAPADLWAAECGAPDERLVGAERLVAWIAGYLRAEAPERPWGY